MPSPSAHDASPAAPALERPLAMQATHLTPTVAPQRGHAGHLREKQAVFAAFAEQALVAEPGFDPWPALDTLAALAGHEHPQAFIVQGRRWSAPWLGWTIDDSAQVVDHHGGWPELGPQLEALPPPWRHAALLSLAFAEDFLIIDAGTLRVRWIAAALPSGWAPEAQLGRPWHRAMPAEGTECISGGRSVSPRLHAHPLRIDTVETPGRRWWRSERCTCIAVPQQPQRILTLRVETQLLP
ncbi:hypothetical protein [Aquabacterium sp.]|uniref:hypothetical protein n=1 Tax=Aquabacterium sp. TaxID=1872578 RepID=UPI002B86829B|nr:hypothetical protein [Aquabacterium sp.]HSW05795.1 hypothetical protein [Aquabacterium sp.]